MTKNFNPKDFQRPGYKQFPILLALFITLFLPESSLAQGQGDSASAKAKSISTQQISRAENLTMQLSQMINAYHGAEKAAEKSGLEEKLITLAEYRKELLLDMMEIDPAAALRLSLPMGLQGNLPPSVQGVLEQKIEVEGELEVLHEDYEDPSLNRNIYYLKTPSGKRISLHFSATPPALLTGSKARIKGSVILEGEAEEAQDIDGMMAVESEQDSVRILYLGEDETGGASGASTATLPNTFGEQRTLVILVNFQDNPDEQPYTTDFASNVIFGETSDFFLENSYGQTWLTGDVVGWYTIPMDSTVCGITFNLELSDYADAAAIADGVDLSAYTRLVYAFPTNACAWWGAATGGGNPSRTWIQGSLELEVAGHEIGHNFGLSHSHSLSCNGTTLGDDCINLEYGDNVDIMGASRSAHFNAFQKERLGWLDAGFGDIVEIDIDGEYSLEPYETLKGSVPKALKVMKSPADSYGFKTWYYMEYRQPIGFDLFLTNYLSGMDGDNLMNGIVVHSGYEGNGGNSCFLLDMTPETYQLYTRDPALPVGRSYSDPDAGVTIRTLWTDGNTAGVDVIFNLPDCVSANPGVTISPSESQWVEPGTEVVYNVTVSNNDNTGCAAATFDLTQNSPVGWTAELADTTLLLEPGEAGSTSLTVISPASASDGFYDITVNVENQANSSYSGSASATYVVSASTNQMPDALDDNAATTKGTPVTIDVLNNDSDPDGDSLNVINITQGSNGVVVNNNNDTLNYTPNSGFTGQDSFNYTISDGNGGTDEATVTVSVTAVNNAPVPVDDYAITDKSSAVAIDVLQNDSDPDGDIISVLSVNQGAKGTVTNNGDGTVTYVPGKRFKNQDSFSYTVTDGDKTGNAVVTVTAQSGDGGGNGGGKGKGKN